MENITLTLDEYKKLLDAEIAPTLLALECAKKRCNNISQ